ncbi:MAG: CoA ester lyase [Caulobacteraceae bacterium]|nr:CoA ester lyase [Caulobacteraceae bacterium]
MTNQWPVWRSLQYVPVHIAKYVETAHSRAADAIILDLEDSVPIDQKAFAREQVAGAAPKVARSGADVLVRINSDPELAELDIDAVVGPGIAALSIPKVESAVQIRRVEYQISQVEARLGLVRGHTRLLILVESAAGFLAMAEIARASPRVVAMTLGGEDFALDVGMLPGEDTLLGPRQQMIITAAAAGVMPLGVLGDATQFRDLEAYEAMVVRSRRFGFVGASCIHPSQIPIHNRAFSPTTQEVDYAEQVLAASEAAAREGRAAFSLDQKMIDAPIIARARRLLDRWQVMKARTPPP